MAAATIPISKLKHLPTLENSDLFVLVDSGSVTTYHTPVNTFENWMWASGSASYAPSSLSSSYSKTSSLTDRTPSASYSVSGSYAVTTSFAENYPGLLNFVSYSLSGSYASHSMSSLYGVSASYSLNIPEYLYFTSGSISSSIAVLSVSCSLANTASYPTTHADYSVTASYMNSAPPLGAKAWMYFVGDAGGTVPAYSYGRPKTSSVNYNFASVSYHGTRHVRNDSSDYSAKLFMYRLYFKSPLANTNYNVMGYLFEFEGNEGQNGHLGMITENFYLAQNKTVNYVDVCATFGGTAIPSVSAGHAFTASVLVV